MQTDQDEAVSQGDGQKEAEEKTPRENEDMEVRCSAYQRYQFIGLFARGRKDWSVRLCRPGPCHDC